MRTPTSEASRWAETTMPCSASTTPAEAAAAVRVSTADRITAATKPLASRLREERGILVKTNVLAHGLEQPLVIKRAFERRELVAKLLVVRCGHAGVEGLAVAPYLDEREMVRMPVPLHDVIP